MGTGAARCYTFVMDSPLSSPSGGKILVVDDEPDILTFIQISLRQRGYGVILATNGEEAVKLALSEHPDLVLLDVVLPDIDGFEVCRRIKTQSKTFIPIILVTVKNDLENKVAGMDHGADDYLTKPFVIEELHTRVTSMLRIKRLYDQQEQASVTDALTGVFNRRYLMVRLKEECERVVRYGGQFSCLMIDLDHFKRLNDTYGHTFGDAVLREFAAQTKALLRKSDIVTRYGGEEFVVILPEAAAPEAAATAESIRKALEAKSYVSEGRAASVTCSLGVFTFTRDAAVPVDDVLKRLDDALYDAKKRGRNRVTVFAA